MNWIYLTFTLFAGNALAAPQLLSFKDGKLGVNFGGYHAGVGLGGLLGGDTANGGLFAEAGTPTGQLARAGLGGGLDGNGHMKGGLYAGATAGGNVKAEAGLGGAVDNDKSAGVGFANAQSGGHYASSGLESRSGYSGSAGFSIGANKEIGGSPGYVAEKEVAVVKPIVHKKVHKEIHFESANEVAPTVAVVKPQEHVEVSAIEVPVQPTYNKEVHVAVPQTTVEKTIIRTRPHHHHHHLRKYITVGTAVEAQPYETVVYTKPVETPVVYTKSYKRVHAPAVIEKRVDVDTSALAGAEASAAVDTGYKSAAVGGGDVSYTKQISVQRNPTFFADIFNIPIQTLSAVGNFLGNTAKSTSVSVQKTASIQAGGSINKEIGYH